MDALLFSSSNTPSMQVMEKVMTKQEVSLCSLISNAIPLDDQWPFDRSSSEIF